MKKRCILIIDDHALFRTGLSMILKQDEQIEHVLEASSIREALAFPPRVRDDIDLILLDIKMPGTSGLDGLEGLQARFANVPVIILSASSESWERRRASQQGAAGYLHKSTSAEEIMKTIDAVLNGEHSFPEIPDSHGGSDKTSNGGQFTARQLEVLALLCQGKPNKIIARELGMAENTVRVHVSAILTNLGATSRAEAILAAQRQGIIHTQ